MVKRLIIGAAVTALVVMAVRSAGPDLRRYKKIRSM
ncbi:hypothetical protein FB559_6001 [Actinoallomurus bryophytorum]|uniref:Uncharacterized protein n=1 Tax=Actinoallomurus bryophytorum TaxID=1490222 RepID=A0A543CT61_9ACTN|nr:hypothetical protein FB559_6001 [Actinoallomurus bryophytorum]